MRHSASMSYDILFVSISGLASVSQTPALTLHFCLKLLHSSNLIDTHVWIVSLIRFTPHYGSFLLQLLKHVTIASGGVLPKIHPELLARKKGGKFPNLVPPTVAPPITKKPAVAAAHTGKPMVATHTGKTMAGKTMAAKKIPPKKVIAMLNKGGKGRGAAAKPAPKSPGAKGGKVSGNVFCTMQRWRSWNILLIGPWAIWMGFWLSSFQANFGYWWLRYLLWDYPQMNVTVPYWW